MIPDFLKRKEIKPDPMRDALLRYIEHFGDACNTETSPWSNEEWVKILNYCIETNKTVEELTGEEIDKDADY